MIVARFNFSSISRLYNCVSYSQLAFDWQSDVDDVDVDDAYD